MFSYIKGTLEYVGKDFVVIDVGGVGYKVNTSVLSLQGVSLKETIKMYTYLHVREDIMAIYGFLTPEELDMFELLISVSGVGPKVAISLISNVSPSKFALCLVTNDVKTLKQAQGIGTKMAQRIILELKDKVKSEQLTELPQDVVQSNDKQSEATNALIALGYSYNEAVKAVKSVEQVDDVETIIKLALKSLVKY